MSIKFSINNEPRKYARDIVLFSARDLARIAGIADGVPVVVKRLSLGSSEWETLETGALLTVDDGDEISVSSQQEEQTK